MSRRLFGGAVPWMMNGSKASRIGVSIPSFAPPSRTIPWPALRVMMLRRKVCARVVGPLIRTPASPLYMIALAVVISVPPMNEPVAPFWIRMPSPPLGRGAVRSSVAPIVLPWARLNAVPGEWIHRPTPELPLIRLPPAPAPPMRLPLAPAPITTPMPFGSGCVPTAFVPIRLPWITLSRVPAPRIATPLRKLAPITFPAPISPIRLAREPSVTKTPYVALPAPADPVASTPIRLPYKYVLATPSPLRTMPAMLSMTLRPSPGAAPPSTFPVAVPITVTPFLKPRISRPRIALSLDVITMPSNRAANELDITGPISAESTTRCPLPAITSPPVDSSGRLGRGGLGTSSPGAGGVAVGPGASSGGFTLIATGTAGGNTTGSKRMVSLDAAPGLPVTCAASLRPSSATVRSPTASRIASRSVNRSSPTTPGSAGLFTTISARVLGVAVAVGVDVAVGAGVSVDVGGGVSLGMGDSVGVAVGTGVSAGSEVLVGKGVSVAVGVIVSVGVFDAVGVGDRIGVSVGGGVWPVGPGNADGVCVGVAGVVVAIRVPVGVAPPIGERT